MKYLLIAVDNLNRDYHPDKIIEISDDISRLKTLASDRNYLNSELFYKVVDRDYKLCFDSLYDIADIDKPSYEQFCKYTGVNHLEPDVAISIYNKQFNIKPEDI